LIVTDEMPVKKAIEGARDGRSTGNPYDQPADRQSQVQRRGIPVPAAKLQQGMAEFVRVMGKVLAHAKQSAEEVGNMELDEIELSVEVNQEGEVSL
jgi:hypothetical protein